MNINLMTLMENIVCNNGKDINYLIERNIINIDDITNEVIGFGNLEYIYNFAYYVRGANIAKLEDAIINKKDARYIYSFAKIVKGANIVKLEDAIINSNNSMYIYYFAKNMKGANIVKLEDAIINTNDSMYIYYFAKNVKGANINITKLTDAIMMIGNYENICLIREYLKQSKINKKNSLLELVHNNGIAVKENEEEIQKLVKSNNKSKTKILIKEEKIDE